MRVAFDLGYLRESFLRAHSLALCFVLCLGFARERYKNLKIKLEISFFSFIFLYLSYFFYFFEIIFFVHFGFRMLYI